jgi:hypothetical protein
MTESIYPLSKFEPVTKSRFITNFKKGHLFSNIPSYCIHGVSNISRNSYKTGLDETLQYNSIVFELYSPQHICIPKIIIDDMKNLNNSINAKIDILDACGSKIYTWEILGSVDYVDFGELSWSKSDVTSISIYVTYESKDLQVYTPETNNDKN